MALSFKTKSHSCRATDSAMSMAFPKIGHAGEPHPILRHKSREIKQGKLIFGLSDRIVGLS